MKKSTLAIVVVGIVAALHMVAGCSKSDDGPQLSDDDLLKRGSAGRSSSMNGAKTAPPNSGK